VLVKGSFPWSEFSLGRRSGRIGGRDWLHLLCFALFSVFLTLLLALLVTRNFVASGKGWEPDPLHHFVLGTK